MNCALIATRQGDCGCPEEDWLVNGLDLTVHFEANGDVDAFLDAGDWEADATFQASNQDEGRAAVFAWVDRLTGRA